MQYYSVHHPFIQTRHNPSKLLIKQAQKQIISRNNLESLVMKTIVVKIMSYIIIILTF